MMDSSHEHLQSAADWLMAARAFERAGEFFRAYDAARLGILRYPDDIRLRHRAVLALPRARATDLALEQYSELRLDRELDTDARALFARLMSDRALAF